MQMDPICLTSQPMVSPKETYKRSDKLYTLDEFMDDQDSHREKVVAPSITAKIMEVCAFLPIPFTSFYTVFLSCSNPVFLFGFSYTAHAAHTEACWQKRWCLLDF